MGERIKLFGAGLMFNGVASHIDRLLTCVIFVGQVFVCPKSIFSGWFASSDRQLWLANFGAFFLYAVVEEKDKDLEKKKMTLNNFQKTFIIYMVYLLTIILAEFSPFMDNELFLINWAGPIPVGKVRQLTINNDLFFSEQQKKTIHFFAYHGLARYSLF